MQSAKSLRKLRSATTAYLEDGSAMLHSIDTLLRDLQHAINDLDAREQAIEVRERQLLDRETKLEGLSDRVNSALDQLLGKSTEVADLSSTSAGSITTADMSKSPSLQEFGTFGDEKPVPDEIIEHEEKRLPGNLSSPERSASASSLTTRATLPRVKRPKKNRRPLR